MYYLIHRGQMNGVKKYDEDVFIYLMRYHHKEGDIDRHKDRLPADICLLIAEYCLHSIHIQRATAGGILNVTNERGLLLDIWRNRIGFRMEFALKLPSIDTLTWYLTDHHTLHFPMCRINKMYELEYNNEGYAVYGLAIELAMDSALNLSMTMHIMGETTSWQLGNAREMGRNGEQERKLMLSVDFVKQSAEICGYEIRPKVDGIVLPASVRMLIIDCSRFIIGQSHDDESDFKYDLIREFKMSPLSSRTRVEGCVDTVWLFGSKLLREVFPF